MRDQCVQRVLIQLENLRTELVRLQAVKQRERDELQASLDALSGPERDHSRLQAHYLLGEVNGLITAELALSERASKYRDLSIREAIRDRHPAPVEPTSPPLADGESYLSRGYQPELSDE